ncbi:MAG TPA: hypothetical protein VKX39_13885 [Bryobacteraceae bacterium]|jgi:hypothetical protein|nr:hypothetical protein [Bryobacteraceae bacterium]
MRDLRKYWQDLHALAASLPADVWLASRDGALVEAPARIAAKMILAKSHRLATEEEIHVRRQEEAARHRQAAAADRRKRGVEVVAVAEKRK